MLITFPSALHATRRNRARARLVSSRIPRFRARSASTDAVLSLALASSPSLRRTRFLVASSAYSCLSLFLVLVFFFLSCLEFPQKNAGTAGAADDGRLIGLIATETRERLSPLLRRALANNRSLLCLQLMRAKVTDRC